MSRGRPAAEPRRALLVAIALAGLAPAAARATDEAVVAAGPVSRAERRAEIVARLHQGATDELRRHAQLTYRLVRREQARFFAAPDARGDEARASLAALQVLSQRAHESTVLEQEKALAESERDRLAAAARLRSEPDGTPKGAGVPLSWPTRGAVVANPGVKRDPATFVRSHLGGIQILARKNAVVTAVGTGVVSKTAALPQGGYAVVITLGDGSIAIVSGLRTLDAVEGAPVSAGERLGLLGRNLDGAPILDLEYWVDGAPVDPRPHLLGKP